MGVFYETIPDSLASWISEQPLFYVGTAPLSALGHVNISPKGGQYFGILSPTLFWYLDLTGSGSETLAHLHEEGNGRITVMFNAFDGPPRIVRLWGKGRVLEYGTPQFNDFISVNRINAIPGTRAVVMVDIHQVGTSCGFSVPKFDFREYRETLNEVFVKRVAAEQAGKKENGIERYWAFKNSYSVDGLPAMKRGLATKELDSVVPMKKMVGPYGAIAATKQQVGSRTIALPAWAIMLAVVLSFLVGVLATLLLQRELGWRYEAL